MIKGYLGILVIPVLAILLGSCTPNKKPAIIDTIDSKDIDVSKRNAPEQEITEIYIINGDHEDNGWFEGPSKSELLKALLEYPEHLFITPSLWKSFCGHREEQLKNLAKENITASLDNLEINDARVYNKNNFSI